MDEMELRNLMYTAQLPQNKSPFSIRYPRGRGKYADWKRPFQEIEIGKARIISSGDDIVVLTIGHPGNAAATVISKLKSEKINIAQYDMRFVAPLDTEVLHEIFKKFRYIITVEDGVIKGGFGSAIIEFMSDNGYYSDVRRLGIPDYFVEHGTQYELQRECGFDAEGIEIAIREMLVRKEGEKG
jgi:1-deoxy-D-xylulose-5-phosphate synthase